MAHDWDPDRPPGKVRQLEALLGAALALSCLSGIANAGSSSANLAVSATVQGVCTASTNPLAFGADIPSVSAATGSANVLVRCNAGVVGYTVAISGSATSGVTRPGLSPLDALAGNFTMLGQVWDGAANPLAAPGADSDLITVTITY
jgi:spore coat protein U-like protein